MEDGDEYLEEVNDGNDEFGDEPMSDGDENNDYDETEEERKLQYEIQEQGIT